MMKILKRKGVVIMAYKSMRDCYIYQQMENIIQEGIAGASSKGRLLTNNELEEQFISTKKFVEFKYKKCYNKSVIVRSCVRFTIV